MGASKVARDEAEKRHKLLIAGRLRHWLVTIRQSSPGQLTDTLAQVTRSRSAVDAKDLLSSDQQYNTLASGIMLSSL